VDVPFMFHVVLAEAQIPLLILLGSWPPCNVTTYARWRGPVPAAARARRFAEHFSTGQARRGGRARAIWRMQAVHAQLCSRRARAFYVQDSSFTVGNSVSFLCCTPVVRGTGEPAAPPISVAHVSAAANRSGRRCRADRSSRVRFPLATLGRDTTPPATSLFSFYLDIRVSVV